MAETQKIYKAISQTMADVGIVGKNDDNNFDKYKYRGIDAVMNALNPAMIKNHIFVVPNVMDIQREERQGKSQTMMYTVLTVKYTFYAEDGSYVESVVIGEAMDRSDKSTNKAMSAAFKYACFQTFCIPTEEMKDSEEESLEIGKSVKKEKKPEKIEEKKPEKTAEEAAEEIENMKISDIKVKSLEEKCKNDGVDPAKILKLYKVKELSGMTEKMYSNCINNWEKIKAI